MNTVLNVIDQYLVDSGSYPYNDSHSPIFPDLSSTISPQPISLDNPHNLANVIKQPPMPFKPIHNTTANNLNSLSPSCFQRHTSSTNASLIHKNGTHSSSPRVRSSSSSDTRSKRESPDQGSRNSRIEDNVDAFFASPQLRSFGPKISSEHHTSELKERIPNYEAPPAMLGRGSRLADNITDAQGNTVYSASTKATSDTSEKRARFRWKNVLKAANEAVCLFLEKDLPWNQQKYRHQSAAVLFLELRVEEVRYCAEHYRSIALLSYRLARKNAYKEMVFDSKDVIESHGKGLLLPDVISPYEGTRGV